MTLGQLAVSTQTVFRKKTRGDETVSPKDFNHGHSYWVEMSSGKREERIYDEFAGLLTRSQFLALQDSRASRNRELHGARRSSRERRPFFHR